MKAGEAQAMRNVVESMKRQLLRLGIVRRAVRDKVLRGGHTDWRALLAPDAETWAEAVQAAQASPSSTHVLIATSVGSNMAATTLEGALAAALTLRGHRVSLLLCDGALCACMACQRDWHNRRFSAGSALARAYCRGCFKPALASYSGLGLPVLRYSSYLDATERQHARDQAAAIPLAHIPSLRQNGIAVGEHALAGALRFFARGELPTAADGEQAGEAVLRQFLQAALTTAQAMQNLLDREGVDRAAFNHGIYVPQGVIGEVLRARKVPQVNWTATYRRQTCVFSKGDTYHKTMLTDPPEHWAGTVWTPAREKRLARYLTSRRHGTGDWIWFFDKPSFDADAALRELGIDPAKPCDGLLTSVMWDAVLHYESNAFPSMIDWILATVRHYAEHPERQLLIRVHPAEVRGSLPSRQRVDTELAKRYGPLPSNVILVAPEHPISTYALMDRCSRVLIYNTKMGVELSAAGKQVVVAGEAWIRGKGFSIDVNSPQEYARALATTAADLPLSPEAHLLAKKYADHFFFQRMVELPMLEPTGGDPQFRLGIGSVLELGPWRSANLDAVCRGIVSDKPILDLSEPEI